MEALTTMHDIIDVANVDIFMILLWACTIKITRLAHILYGMIMFIWIVNISLFNYT